MSRLTRAWITLCGSPVRRESAETSARRSSRSRSRRSCAVSSAGRDGALAGAAAVCVNAASAGDGGGSAANSDIVSPGCVVSSISASPCALDESARNASPGSERTRSAASSSGSPLGSSVSAWRRSSSTCAASRLSVGSAGRKTWLICSFGTGVRRMKRPTTWRKNSSVRALVA